MRKTFHSFGFSTEGILISASAVPVNSRSYSLNVYEKKAITITIMGQSDSHKSDLQSNTNV